jgi:ketosteroid isomerase-like protein
VFDWLFEGRMAVYVSLAAVAIVLLAAWRLNRRGRWLIGVGAVAVLAGLYFLLDRLVETDREQVVRKVQEMAAGVRTRNADAIFTHISERFNRGGVDRAQFRAAVDGILRSRVVDEVEVWDFQFPDDFRREVRVPGQTAPGEAILVSFTAKAKGGVAVGEFGRCDATFVRDPDGQWRLFSFQVFNPAVDANQPVQLPGL